MGKRLTAICLGIFAIKAKQAKDSVTQAVNDDINERTAAMIDHFSKLGADVLCS